MPEQEHRTDLPALPGNRSSLYPAYEYARMRAYTQQTPRVTDVLHPSRASTITLASSRPSSVFYPTANETFLPKTSSMGPAQTQYLRHIQSEMNLHMLSRQESVLGTSSEAGSVSESSSGIELESSCTSPSGGLAKNISSLSGRTELPSTLKHQKSLEQRTTMANVLSATFAPTTDRVRINSKTSNTPLIATSRPGPAPIQRQRQRQRPVSSLQIPTTKLNSHVYRNPEFARSDGIIHDGRHYSILPTALTHRHAMEPLRQYQYQGVSGQEAVRPGSPLVRDFGGLKPAPLSVGARNSWKGSHVPSLQSIAEHPAPQRYYQQMSQSSTKSVERRPKKQSLRRRVKGKLRKLKAGVLDAFDELCGNRC